MFTCHTEETAPADAAPLIQASTKAHGFFPKLHQVTAEAPATCRAIWPLVSELTWLNWPKT